MPWQCPRLTARRGAESRAAEVVKRPPASPHLTPGRPALISSRWYANFTSHHVATALRVHGAAPQVTVLHPPVEVSWWGRGQVGWGWLQRAGSTRLHAARHAFAIMPAHTSLSLRCARAPAAVC